jgi:hypothetical protein
MAAIGSLEQAADEARARLDAARADERTVTRAIETKVADGETTARKLVAAAERE